MTDNEWFKSLKPGDTVYIRKPWFDHVYRGGELHKGIVADVFKSGCILVGGFGVFHPGSWKANFNTTIERTTDSLVLEYEKQHPKHRTVYTTE